jgi:hypothetical protein
MGQLEKIIQVNVSRQTSPLSRAGFGTPLIFGQHTVFPERARVYGSADALLDDGFTTSDPEYLMAARAFSQAVKPPQVIVGRRVANVAQEMNVNIDTVLDSTNYTVTINGTDFTHNSGVGATAASISLGLVTLINAGSEPVSAADNVGDLDILADNAGQPFTLAVNANMTITTVTAVVSVASELALVQDFNNDWYAVLLDSHNIIDQEVMADFIETQSKIYVTSSDDPNLIAVSAADIASILGAKSYVRTAVMYSGDEANFPEAAWVGGQLPQVPGTVTWAYKTLVGITPDALTDNQISNLESKNANFYFEIVDGEPITREGKMVGNEFIDIIHHIDEFVRRSQENILIKLTLLPKIPYTTKGIATIEAEIWREINRGIRLEVIANDPEAPPTVSTLPVLEQDPNDRASRILREVKYQYRVAGAIHELVIDGTVTV